MMRTLAATAFLAALGTGAAPAAEPPLDIQKWAREYDAAFTAKDLGRLASFYHPDVTIYEHSHTSSRRRPASPSPAPSPSNR